jgi:hypothetical protein
MADVAHLDPAAADDAVEAEPDERSRRALICLPPCLFIVALVAFSWLRELGRSSAAGQLIIRTQPRQPRRCCISPANVLWCLAVVHACWLAPVFMLLVAEWWRGNPEGRRFVDTLLQSDERWLLRVPIRQVVHHIY